jgi:hypothetical protein
VVNGIFFLVSPKDAQDPGHNGEVVPATQGHIMSSIGKAEHRPGCVQREFDAYPDKPCPHPVEAWECSGESGHYCGECGRAAWAEWVKVYPKAQTELSPSQSHAPQRDGKISPKRR